ncbi:DUF4333 domain-containing protein [Luteipulveratus mongoliensis]|uniref:DUF4333 domain-containing protein n=1 Tax=Luteipulveratus mongoliensis TaxID=571913 RepID=A0A0K1JF54_9MICO|nr:DUF4333 domain-containing protein [Luteipulveratus mongoliensis]AKU15357.1 hypothetical protein VV02_04895 [Luteipulveratus mongoliensis]
MSTARRSIAAAAAGTVLIFGLAGCSKEVDNGKVEKELKRVLQERAPDHKYGKVECHDDLKAEVGAKSDCDIQVDGAKIKYDAKVTKVDGDNVSYSFLPNGKG